MKTNLFSRIALVLVVVAILVSAAACAAPTATPVPTSTPVPTATPSPEPTATPTPVPPARFATDLNLTVAADDPYKGATMEIKTDGTFTVVIPGFPGVDGTGYTLNADGKTIDVVNGQHAYTFTQMDGEVIVTLSAGGGAVTIKFYTNYDKYHE